MRRLVLLLMLLVPAPALADAPYMGVDTWYAYGSAINEQTIVALTNAAAARGLERVGYRYIWIEAGWWYGQRDASGNIILDPAQWPHGMRWLVNYIHARGFVAGIYTDLGLAACRNGGSYGHFQQDVNTFAAWGFDAVKADACGAYAFRPWNPRRLFGAFERAIVNDRPHRVMLLNVGNGDIWDRYPQTAYDDYAWASKFPEPTSWRTGSDLSWPGSITWAHVLRNIDADSAHPEVVGPGHWSEPDYLAPTLLPPHEARAQFTMWAVLAAPMMVGVDVPNASASVIAMLTNREAIAISQDPLGIQARCRVRVGPLQVWLKPLVHRRLAVAILNRSARTRHIVITGRMLGIRGRMWVRHVWGHWTSHVRQISVTVRGDSALLLRIE